MGLDSIGKIGRMRQIDAKAVILGLPIFLMMENAGNTLARYTQENQKLLEQMMQS
jgi:NAD(P)H-hydrate repair Nnr-like enzyme with NAD(P)H-hydrate epimerase domain